MNGINREQKKAYVMVVNVGPREIETEVDLRGLRVSGSAVARTLHSADRLGLESQKAKVEESKCALKDGRIEWTFLPASLTCIEVGLE